jgi:hypothetical protein
MNRAFSAVFHFRDKFSRVPSVDTLCMEWKTGTESLTRPGSSQYDIAGR